DVEHVGERRAGRAADLHLHLVERDRVRAVRLVPERELGATRRDGDRLRERTVAVDRARRAELCRVAAGMTGRGDPRRERTTRAPAAEAAGLEASVRDARPERSGDG